MDPFEAFRRLFGIPHHNRHSYSYDNNSDWHNRWPDDEDEDGERRGSFPFNSDENPGENDDDHFEIFIEIPQGEGRGQGIDGMFEHFHGHMWRQMETLNRQMDDMMKGFGFTEGPSDWGCPSASPKPPQIEGDLNPGSDNSFNPFRGIQLPVPFFGHGGREKKTPRDFLLKDPDEDLSPPIGPPLEPNVPKISPIFTPPSPSKKRADTDLDGKISEDELLSLVKKPPQTEIQSDMLPGLKQPSGFFSSSRSVTFTTIQGTDGKVEQKKVVRDSSGNEETTVTRSVGDQSHIVKTIIKGDGQQEKSETFKNMDEQDMGQFEEKWNKPANSTPQRNPVDSLLAPAQAPLIDRGDLDIFSKFFGRWDK